MDEEHQYRNLLLGRLRQETQQKVSHLCLPQYALITSEKPVFVLEWMETTNRRIVGFGCDAHGSLRFLQLNTEPGLYAVVSDLHVLNSYLIALDYSTTVRIFHKFKLRSNSFSVIDLLQNYDSVIQKPCVLVKIITPSVRETTDLYFRFLKNEQTYKFINVPMYWTINWQIMFDRLVKYHENTENVTDYTMPKIIHRWFDGDLCSYKAINPTLPIITFDIETVANDPNRVPTGEDCNDILFTVSIYYRHTHTLYTLIALPLTQQTTEESIRMIRSDDYSNDYDYFNKPTTKFECYKTEKELLIRTMELLRPPGVHYLLGYNSMAYDIKYLLMRCAFFNLPLDEFVYRDGYSTCMRQIHIDLFRTVRSKFDKVFKNYKLGTVCTKLFNLNKQDVDAVKIRYTYAWLKKLNRYVSTQECLGRDFPPISHICHYNNYDTLLTDKLEACIDGINYMVDQAHSGRMSLSSLNVHLRQVKCRLWSNLTIQGLEKQIFLTTFKPSTYAIKEPIYNDENATTDFIGKIYNFDNLLSLEKFVGGQQYANQQQQQQQQYQISVPNEPKQKIKYPGGANFCLGLFEVDDIQMYDYKTAYPLLIDRDNISDETSVIMMASVLLTLMHQLTLEQRSTFVLYDYYVHTGRNKSETAILYYKYLELGLRCGGKFPFTESELRKRGSAPIVVIWKGRSGVLSQIIKNININRETTKRIRDVLKSIIARIDERSKRIKDKQMKLLFMTAMSQQQQQQQQNSKKNDDDKESTVVATGKDGDGAVEDGDYGDDFGNDDNAESETSFIKNDNDDDNADSDFGNEDIVDDNDDDGDDFGIDDDDDGNTENRMDTIESADANDDDFGNEDVVAESPVVNRKINDIGFVGSDPYNFKLPSNIVSIDNSGSTTFNDAYLNDLDIEEHLKILHNLRELVNVLYVQYTSSYTSQKVFIASIYGCIGATSQNCAAIITNIIRSTLIQAAQHMSKCGYTIYFMDTDSIFAKHPTSTKNMSAELNSMFPHTEIEMKVYPRCMFVQKKSYLKIDDDGNVNYFQNNNGPDEWRKFVQFMFQQQWVTTNRDIERAFELFFNQYYTRLMSYTEINDEFLQSFMRSVAFHKIPKTNTPIKRFREFLQLNYPTVASTSKHQVYYIFGNGLDVELRPEIHFTNLNQRSTINAFKYFDNMFKTVYNILLFAMIRNNKPNNIMLNENTIRCLMISAYFNVYYKFFPSVTSELVERHNAMISNVLVVGDNSYVDIDDEEDDDNSMTSFCCD